MTVGDIAYRLQCDPGLVSSTFREGDATVVEFWGDADIGTLSVVVAALDRVIAGRDGPVVVDLAGIGFIDTATVRAVIVAGSQLRDLGRRLQVRSPSRLARRMLTLSGFDHVIDEREPTRI